MDLLCMESELLPLEALIEPKTIKNLLAITKIQDLYTIKAKAKR